MKSPTEIHQAIKDAGGYVYERGEDGVRFSLPSTVSCAAELHVIASWGLGWDHASVHAEIGTRTYTPTWDAMERVKHLLWKHDEWAIQYHPAGEDHINVHTHTLHIWRCQAQEPPKPPKEFV